MITEKTRTEERILTAARVFVETCESVGLEIEGEPARARETIFSEGALGELVRAVHDGR